MRVAAITVVFVHFLWEIFIFYSHASLHEYHLICRVSLDCNKSEDENNDVQGDHQSEKDGIEGVVGFIQDLRGDILGIDDHQIDLRDRPRAVEPVLPLPSNH